MKKDEIEREKKEEEEEVEEKTSVSTREGGEHQQVDGVRWMTAVPLSDRQSVCAGNGAYLMVSL